MRKKAKVMKMAGEGGKRNKKLEISKGGRYEKPFDGVSEAMKKREEGVPLFSVLSSFPNLVGFSPKIRNKLGKFALFLIYLGFIIYAPNNVERNLTKVIKKDFDERVRNKSNNSDLGNSSYIFSLHAKKCCKRIFYRGFVPHLKRGWDKKFRR